MGKLEQFGEKVYYVGEVAEKYDESSSLNNIQGKITEKCLEIMKSPRNSLVLDIGCGSGISTERIMDKGNFVTGVDISREMLVLAKRRVQRIEYEGRLAEKQSDFLCVDIGEGLPFKSASFDYAVSVSVLQWLCVQADHKKLLNAFFYTLYDVLKATGMAVLQYFPENDKQMEEVMKYASKNGFAGGTLVESSDSKKKRKTYLVLEMACSKGGSVHVKERRKKKVVDPKRIPNKELSYRDWIARKKEKRRGLGMHVPEDSKYTGRKRSRRI